MDLSFANPAGFWALLGLPAVLLIHFLQRRARPQVITTLFLLDPQRQESAGGHRFQRLRTSIPFWLQLLMVFGLTWLLVEPRWLRSQSVQRLAVVLDDSASMQAFRDRATDKLASHLTALRPVAATTEYTVLTSAPDAPRLYHGPEATQAVQALAGWNPWLGAHDTTNALRAARSAVGQDGIVILVTDRAPAEPLPYATRHLAVGEALPNFGWTGVTIEEDDKTPVIKVMVRNFGPAPASRRWWIESPDGRKSESATIELDAGQSRLLEAPFPADQDSLILTLEADRFAADDRLPLVRPAPKILAVALPSGESPSARAYRELFSAFPHTRAAETPAGTALTVVGYDPLAPALPSGAACVFASDPQPGASYLAGLILAEPGPLMDGLNWQGLLVRDTLPIPRLPQDRVVLWQADRPLIAERLSPTGHRQLLFNFDLHTSNARKLPAFAVVLHRFLEQLRSDLVAPEALNVHTGQKLTIARRTGPDAPTLRLHIQPLPASGPASSRPEDPPGDASTSRDITQPTLLRAPPQPAFFEITQGSESHLRAAAHFVDPRESDFTTALTADTLADLQPVLIEQHSEADTRWRLWTLAVLAILMLSWYFSRS